MTAAQGHRADTIRRCIDAGRKMRACNELAPAALAEVFGMLTEIERLRGALERVRVAPLATDDAQRIAEEALSRV